MGQDKTTCTCLDVLDNGEGTTNYLECLSEEYVIDGFNKDSIDLSNTCSLERQRYVESLLPANQFAFEGAST